MDLGSARTLRLVGSPTEAGSALRPPTRRRLLAFRRPRRPGGDNQGITSAAPATVLLGYLQAGREALLYKLDALGDYDVRRPMTPTGTNLLGLVKHLTGIEAAYLGDAFGRPWSEPLPWIEPDAEANAGMWATTDEALDDVVARYRRVWAHADATVATLPLDEPGHVPWWPARTGVTLERVLVHVATETHRHAGHADLIRELIDGRAGLRASAPNLAGGGPSRDDDRWWAGYCARLETVARAAGR